MHLNSKKILLVVLAITGIACSKTFFWLLNDPEGANLLIVTVLALIVYGLSLIAYSFARSDNNLKKLLLAISVQIVLTLGFYVWLG